MGVLFIQDLLITTRESNRNSLGFYEFLRKSCFGLYSSTNKSFWKSISFIVKKPLKTVKQNHLIKI